MKKYQYAVGSVYESSLNGAPSYTVSIPALKILDTVSESGLDKILNTVGEDGWEANFLPTSDLALIQKRYWLLLKTESTPQPPIDLLSHDV